MPLNENIRTCRIAAGLTQVDLAAAVHVKQGTVAGWESGRRQPGAETVVAIARACGVTPGALLGDADGGLLTRADLTAIEAELRALRALLEERLPPLR